jgi:hypothetical protein
MMRLHNTGTEFENLFTTISAVYSEPLVHAKKNVVYDIFNSAFNEVEGFVSTAEAVTFLP